MTPYSDVDVALALKIKHSSEVVFSEPPGYKSELKRFQKQGVAFLYTIKRGI